jgi:hypothetical protein
VLEYDFLIIKDSNAPETPQRIPVIKDELSHFAELIPHWYKRFGLPLFHVSDQCTHLKNQFLSEFNCLMQAEHHHQANGRSRK